ncbi:MAG: molecular chaperone DnaJ [Desulfuromonas sp.]|nr:MAG: molecular chaperone DnaJ [Desulfuromonas sp.]
MTYAELREALEVFGLDERVTLKQIKQRHRELVRAHHPDHHGDQKDERMTAINAAYAVLNDYCSGYRFNFSREEFLEQNPEERLRSQFSNDPVWGG